MVKLKDILKRLKISQATKSNWRQELLEYQMMYNSTPHSTTGKTPSEWFFRRQFRDKIPSSINTEHIQNEETRNRDQIQKEKGKSKKTRKGTLPPNLISKLVTKYTKKLHKAR